MVFAILTVAPLISESLLGNTRVIVAILQKCLGTFFEITSTISLTLVFREFIFDFDFRCVSRKFTAYLCLHLSKERLLMQFTLSEVLGRTIRFLTTVHVVLEEYNNYMSNNK